jgi:hypothetical protein
MHQVKSSDKYIRFNHRGTEDTEEKCGRIEKVIIPQFSFPEASLTLRKISVFSVPLWFKCVRPSWFPGLDSIRLRGPHFQDLLPVGLPA